MCHLAQFFPSRYLYFIEVYGSKISPFLSNYFVFPLKNLSNYIRAIITAARK